jgi:histidine kinase/two-component system sensor kinase Ihk
MINEIIEKYFINEKPFFEYKSNIDVELNVNKQQFLVVIKNLLSNAVKYRNDKPVDIILQKNSFSVINYGSEIPKEHLKHLTDAFYRVDSSRQRASGGVGLGLFLVNEILKAHKFKLEIESNKTKTEFKVVFS